MAQKEKITFFHLYRKDGTYILLHPFDDGDKLIELLEKYDFKGKYGKEPRVESLTLFRNELYRLIENSVRSWVAEVRFIPKFLISAAVFLVSYLFLSLVIRDPLPMVDETVFSLGFSMLTYILLGRRDQRSDATLKKRVALRTIVDRIVFDESIFVKKVEDALHKTESESTAKIIEDMISPLDSSFAKEDEEDALQLIKYLRKRFNSRDFRKQEKVVERLVHEKDKEPGRNKKMLSVWAESKKIDISLFSVYTRVKKRFEKVK